MRWNLRNSYRKMGERNRWTCGERMLQSSDNEKVYVVRRITPLEAERLQAFPDGYTDIEYNGRPAPDTLRYKALGNSMTVSVMRYIAERILIADREELNDS